MGLFQGIVDFYDYKIPYYRYYVQRRILFSDDSQYKDKPIQGLFSNKDYENFGLIMRKSTKYFILGGICYSLIVSPKIYYSQKVPINKLVARGAVFTTCAGVAGVLYATFVYSIANLRGQKNDAINHVCASALAMPTFAIFAKKDRLSAALAAAIYPALVFGFLKLGATGGLDYNKFTTKFDYTPAQMKKDQLLFRDDPTRFRSNLYGAK